MARITVQNETETPRGWSYLVHVEREGADRSEHLVTLSWADHEHWTGGATPPSRLIEAIVRILADHQGEGDVPRSLPRRFDASTARRWRVELEGEVAEAL